MADQKLTALSAISQANVDDTALLYIVDVTGGNVSRKVTKGNLFAGTKTTQLVIGLPTGPTGSASVFYGGVKIPAATVTFATTAQTNDYYTNFLDQATLVNPSSGTVPNAATLKIVGAPIASTNVTITNAYALWVAGGTSLFEAQVKISPTSLGQSVGFRLATPTQPTGSASEYTGAFAIPATTATFQTTAQSGDYITAQFNQVTLVNPSSGTIPSASTVKIIGAPIASTNVTITNGYALWVAAGTTKLDGSISATGLLTSTGGITMSSADITLALNKLKTSTYFFQEGTQIGQTGVLLQTSVTNSYTQLLLAPNGSSTSNQIAIARVSDYTTNFEILQIGSDIISTGYSFRVAASGSGSNRPMNFYMGTTKLLSFDTGNTVTIYSDLIMSAGSSNAIVTNDLIFAATGAGQPGTLIQRNGAGGQMLSLVSGTTTNAGLQIFRTTDYTTNYSGLRLDIDYSNSAAWTLGPFKGGSGSLFPMYFQMGSGTNIIGIQTSGKISFFNQLDTYNNISTAGMGVVPVYGSTKQKSETGADTNVLTLTPPAVAGSYRIKISVDVSAASVATFGWTATWKDSNGTSQAPTNLAFDKAGSATLNLTVTAAANDHYTADMYIDIDNSATNIVIKTTFSGTSIAYKISASIEQIQ